MPFSVSSPSLRGISASRHAAGSKAASVAAPVVPKRARQIIVNASNVDGIVTEKRQPAAASLAGFFAAIAVTSGLAVPAGPAAALGLESIPIPALENAVASTSASASLSASAPLTGQAAKLADADAAFESSELLRTLKERTAANAESNKKAITDKYCLRQSELGVGDCAGLRLIPGATKSGKQKTPKLLAKLIGKEDAIDAYNNNEANDAAIAAVEKMRKNAAP